MLEKLKKWYEEGKIQDLEANIEILQKGGWHAKLHSFLCAWWPFRGSIESHIEYLQMEIMKIQYKGKV